MPTSKITPFNIFDNSILFHGTFGQKLSCAVSEYKNAQNLCINILQYELHDYNEKFALFRNIVFEDLL